MNIDLQRFDTRPPSEAKKSDCKAQLKTLREKLHELQRLFYADGRFALLIVMQGVDCSGKDGTIRHVFSGTNPAGIEVSSFKEPTPIELAHDFMWRIYPHFPARGMIGIFNRSHYEDLVVPLVSGELSETEFQHRAGFINQVEQHLMHNNTHVLKFFLHLSREKQEKRIAERLEKPRKRWKYSAADERAAEQWSEYQSAYQRVLAATQAAPWHVIPADKRWYRNLRVGEIIAAHLESLPLRYPPLEDGE